MSTFLPLDPQSPLSGKILLEASAGTGKTFAIEHTVCRLILEGTPLGKILITTFTQAGARDLQKRIQQTLQKNLERIVTDNTEEIPYLDALESKQTAILHIKNALSLLAEAEIHTIHSFCYRMLQIFSWEAKTPICLETPEPHEQRTYLKEKIFDALRTIHREFSPGQLQALFRPFKRDLQKFIQKALTLLEKTKTVIDLKNFSESNQAFLEHFSEVSDIQELLLHFKRTQKQSGTFYPHVQKQIDAFLDKDLDTLIALSPSIFDLVQKSNQKKTSKLNTRLENLQKKMLDFAQEFQKASSPQALMLRVVKKTQDLIQKDPNKKIFVDELLYKMQEKINLSSFYQKVSERFSCVIIDEFQDTDPVQWDILSRLFWPSAKLFLVVGDPKQSIYAFRGANLQTFLEAKKAFPMQYRLDTNYRSAPEVLQNLNALFETRQKKHLFTLTPEKETISYENLSAGISTTSSGECYLCFSEEKNFEEIFFSEIYAKILEVQKEIPLQDMAILIKDRYQSDRIACFLQKKGIPCMQSGNKPLCETECFTFLEIATQIIQSPRNTNLLKQLLLHPFIGWPKEKLIFDFTDPDYQKVFHIFCDLKKIFLETHIIDAYRTLFAKDFGRGPLMHTLLHQENAYSDLLQIWTHLLQTHPEDPQVFFQNIRSLDAEVSPKQHITKDQDAIQILTSHMSKGLEFRVVFALGVATRGQQKWDFIQNKKNQLSLFSLDPEQDSKNLLLSDREKIRLLYVALTRAKEKLYLFFPKQEKKPSLGNASPLELFFTAQTSTIKSYTELYEQIEHLDFDTVQNALKNTTIQTAYAQTIQTLSSLEKNLEDISVQEPLAISSIEPRVQTLSFSSLQKKTHSSIQIPKELSLPAGKETGSLIHLLLEKILESGLYFPWNSPSIQNFLEKELKGTDFYASIEEIYKILSCALQTPLQETWSLQDIPPEHIFQEMAFSYTKNSRQALKGFMDLVFIKDNTYYILDWKMNVLPEYTQQTIHQAMKDNDYYEQARIYTEALQKDLASLPQKFGGVFYFFLRGFNQGLIHFCSIQKPQHTKQLTSIEVT